MTPPLLHHIWVSPPPASQRSLCVLHGILGSGQNFRAVARQLARTRPDWGVLLVDLRMHGRSLAMPGPHTLAAAAEDLRALEAALPAPPAAVIGHSFGGKVAAAYAERREQHRALEHLWILDSPLGARAGGEGSEDVLRVVSMLEGAPERFESRRAFVEHVLGEGMTEALGQWLAMNLVREGDGFRFALDLTAVRQLLDDYFRTDLWPWLERAHTPTSLVIAERSQVWSDSERARAEQIAANCEHVRLHVVPNAGHWLHVDNPQATVATILSELPA